MKVNVSFWLSEKLKQSIKIKCIKEGTNMSEVIRKKLKEYLNEKTK